MSGTHTQYLDQQLLFALLERMTVAIEKLAEQSAVNPQRDRVKVNKESVAIAFVAKLSVGASKRFFRTLGEWRAMC